MPPISDIMDQRGAAGSRPGPAAAAGDERCDEVADNTGMGAVENAVRKRREGGNQSRNWRRALDYSQRP